MTTDDRKRDLISAAAKAFDEGDWEKPTWQEDPVGRDAALRWHMRGFEAGMAFEAAQKPTDDEREALTLIVRDVHNYDGRPGYLALHGADAARIADAILAAGFRRPVPPERSAVTDDMRRDVFKDELRYRFLPGEVRKYLTIYLEVMDEYGPEPQTEPTAEQYANSFSGWDAEEVARNPQAAAEAINNLRSRLLDTFRRPVPPEPSATVLAEVREHAERWANRPPTSPYAMGLRDAWRTILRRIDGLAAGASNAGALHRAEPQGEPTDAQAWAAARAVAALRKKETGAPAWFNVEHARAALRAAAEEGKNRP